MAGRMIRRIRSGEENGVVSLFSQAAEAAHWSALDLVQLEATGTCVWVDEEGGDLTGVVAMRVVAGEAEILNLAVGAGWRKRGIGRRLMAAALQEATASGARRVFLEVRESNAGARAFYAGLGFSQDGRRRNYYRDPPEDALLLARNV
jgi:[ribosomal protein S18]-alanine N-acetyltransferase